MAASRDPNAIAPDGDVTLVCGADIGDGKIIKLRVVTTIMGFGSDVFKALLAPRFREGNTLATNGFVEVPLPEDDGKIMRHLCNIFHLKGDALPDQLSAEEILSLARVCDKYHCTSAVRSYSSAWIDKRLITTTHNDRLRLLESAKLLKYDAGMKKIKVELILHATPGCSLLSEWRKSLRRYGIRYAPS